MVPSTKPDCSQEVKGGGQRGEKREDGINGGAGEGLSGGQQCRGRKKGVEWRQDRCRGQICSNATKWVE